MIELNNLDPSAPGWFGPLGTGEDVEVEFAEEAVEDKVSSINSWKIEKEKNHYAFLLMLWKNVSA